MFCTSNQGSFYLQERERIALSCRIVRYGTTLFTSILPQVGDRTCKSRSFHLSPREGLAGRGHPSLPAARHGAGGRRDCRRGSAVADVPSSTWRPRPPVAAAASVELKAAAAAKRHGGRGRPSSSPPLRGRRLAAAKGDEARGKCRESTGMRNNPAAAEVAASSGDIWRKNAVC